jgi:hypothetical protein
MKLPPMIPNPCSAQTAPAIVTSTPATMIQELLMTHRPLRAASGLAAGSALSMLS